MSSTSAHCESVGMDPGGNRIMPRTEVSVAGCALPRTPLVVHESMVALMSCTRKTPCVGSHTAPKISALLGPVIGIGVMVNGAVDCTLAKISVPFPDQK